MNLREKARKYLEELDPEIEESKVTLFFQRGEYIGQPYAVFIFAGKYKELKNKYTAQVGDPVVFGIIQRRENADLYIIQKRVGETTWREFDILVKETPQKVWGQLKSIIEKLKEIHEDIERVDDPRLDEYISKLIDTERRVKEGGMLIAAYINYLEGKITNLESIIPRGWGGLVLQLMVMYFLHKRRGKLDALKFSVIEAYEDVRRGKITLDAEGYDLWTLLRGDLEKFERISRDSLFSTKEYDILKEREVKIENKWFIGNAESLRTFKYENIRAVLKKFSRAIFESEAKFTKAQSELWKKFEGLGIMPLFEVRRWYEAGLIGDVIGGVYEGIKKIEERKKGGIYYTPRFIVEYIVNNTLEPYIRDILKDFGDYESFSDFLAGAEIKDLEKFYAKLTDIQILDPACGTGHFLVYAMEKLVQDYYYPLWARCAGTKDVQFPVKVLYSKNGKLTAKELNLCDVDKDAVPFLVRTHLILKNNIYGVDIDNYAHRIAKARMMIDAFWNYNEKVQDESGLYALPNLEMNIKTGNSLIGFASWDEVPGERRRTLFDYEGGPTKIEEIKSMMAEVKRTGDIEEYERKMSVLRDKTNEVFVEYLQSNGVCIDMKKLGYEGSGLRAFHWIIEFPDVFEGDEPGFDVVVGNPPYGNTERVLTPTEKSVITGLYDLFGDSSSGLTTDVAVLFIYRGLYITVCGGTLSYIATNKWIRSDYGENIRDFLVSFRIEEIVNFETKMVFPDATAYTAIIRVKNLPVEKNHNLRYVPPEGTEPENKVVKNIDGYLIPHNSLGAGAWTLANPVLLEIKRYMERTGTKIGDMNPSIYRGITTGYNDAFIIDTETRNRLVEEDTKSAELIKPLLRGKNTGRYYLDWGGEYLLFIPWHFPLHNDSSITGASKRAEEEFKKQYPYVYSHLLNFRDALSMRNKSEIGIRYEWYALQRYGANYYHEFHKPKVVWQEIAHRPQFSWDPGMFYGDATTFISVVLGKDKLLVLNSSTVLKYFSTVAPVLRGGFFRFKKTYVERIPLPRYGEEDARSLEMIADYLLQLNATEDLRNEHGDIIRFLDREVADSIVYELYFREKFHEDELYPEPKNYLLEAVAKHLKPIEYDRWAELYWKKQIEGELSEDEETELKRLEEENLKTIEEVYKALESDEEVQNWIKKIKGHEWVRVIEGA